MEAETGRFWICLKCRRHVPARSLDCQCGFSRKSVSVGPTVVAASRREPKTRESWLGPLALAAAGVAVLVLGVLTTRHPETKPLRLLRLPPPAFRTAAIPSSRAGAPRATRASEEQPLGASLVFERTAPFVVVVEAFGGAQGVQGSGVLLTPNRVITSKRIVQGASRVRVRQGASELSVQGVFVDPDHDLALVKVSSSLVSPPATRSAKALRVGEPVFAVGAPSGLELSLSEGLVSALRPHQGGQVIQTTAALSPGSSGGGLFDGQGRLLGITTLALRDSEGSSFAIPVDWVLAIGEPVTTAPHADSQPPASITAASPSLPPQSPDPEAELDRLRRTGTLEFEQRMATLGEKADQADVAWERFRAGCFQTITEVTSCAAGSAGAAGLVADRDWVGIGVVAVSAASCSSARRTEWTAACAEAGTFFSLTDQVKQEMCVAEDRARRAWTLPGTRRDLRSKYRLDWSGWDGVC